MCFVKVLLLSLEGDRSEQEVYSSTGPVGEDMWTFLADGVGAGSKGSHHAQQNNGERNGNNSIQVIQVCCILNTTFSMPGLTHVISQRKRLLAFEYLLHIKRQILRKRRVKHMHLMPADKPFVCHPVVH